LFGPYVLTQKAIPHLEKVHGHIIFISSVFATKIIENSIDYNMSKAAMNMMAKIIAKEEGEKYAIFLKHHNSGKFRGIRVNIVSPGAIATDLLASQPRFNNRYEFIVRVN